MKLFFFLFAVVAALSQSAFAETQAVPDQRTVGLAPVIPGVAKYPENLCGKWLFADKEGTVCVKGIGPMGVGSARVDWHGSCNVDDVLAIVSPSGNGLEIEVVDPRARICGKPLSFKLWRDGNGYSADFRTDWVSPNGNSELVRAVLTGKK